MLENINSEDLVPLGQTEEPTIDQSAVRRLVATFLTVVRSQAIAILFESPHLYVPLIISHTLNNSEPAILDLLSSSH